jgi:serine/threonine protein kinase
MEGDAQSQSRLQPGVVVGGKYRLLRVLGRGGMGQVFEAEHDGKRVALKSLFRIEDGTAGASERARFQREAGATRGLESEHLIQVLDHGFDEGIPFLVMELLDGEDLESAVKRVGPLDPAVAGAIVAQACRGLAVAHDAGIVHRDIKPANIFLQRKDDGTLVAKVCDFGVAKVVTEEGLTATGSVLGSPLYMPPEQLRNAKLVDARCDVWSLGMSLYHALAGVAALERVKTFADLVVALSRGDFPAIQDVAPWVPADLARVLHGTILVDPAARCPSMRELHVALTAALPKGMRLTADLVAPLSADRMATLAPKIALPKRWESPSAAAFESTMMEEEDALLGQTLAGKYALRRVLGRGGMGAVYEAKGTDGKGYAVKVIRPDLGDTKGREATKRFVREARASQGIESPYVAQILDAGSDDARGLPYIAMELLSGHDLGRVIKDVGPLEPEAVIPIFVQACEGLAAAHGRGIVHRDIKPANIFLHEEGGAVTAKLCDFGVAKQIAQMDEGTELTRTGGVLGSPMYMSPEQATNAKNVDHRSDLWSLGMSLYEALTGHKPWEGTSMGELILAICTREVQPLTELAPWVSPPLAAIVNRALARKPDDRFQSAEDFAAALRPLAKSKTVKADAFRTPSEERRRIAAAARSSPSVARSTGGISTVAGQTAPVDKPKGRGAAFALVAVIAVAGGLGVTMLRRDPAPAKADEAASAATAPAAPKTVQAKVAVGPSGASVTVNGGNANVVDGNVVVEGAPGDGVLVGVTSDAGHVETHVVITSDGKAVPARVEVPEPAAPASASASKSPVAGHAKPASATPHAAPSAAPSAPTLKRSW